MVDFRKKRELPTLYWRDSDIIPKICKTFDFLKNYSVNLFSVENESMGANSGVPTEVAFFFEKLIKLCNWTNLFKIDRISKIFFLYGFSVSIPTAVFEIIQKIAQFRVIAARS